MNTITENKVMKDATAPWKKALSFLANNSTIVVFIIMLVMAGFLSDKFYSEANLTNVLRQSVPLGLVALGMFYVILTGGIDLSVGSIIALVSVIVAMLIPSVGLPMAILIGLGSATIIGCVSGGLVSYFKIAPFVATLAMMTIARGLSLIISKGQPIFIDDMSFVDFGTGYFLGLPLPVYVLIVAVAIAHFVYQRTSFGRLVISIGSNEVATRFAGIRVERFKFAVYAISGFACGVAGIIAATRTGVGSPVLGIAFELDVIAAVVIGGASLSGGRGTVFNTIIGVLILAVISNLMNLMNISGYHQQVVKGVIIILAVLLESFKSK